MNIIDQENIEIMNRVAAKLVKLGVEPVEAVETTAELFEFCLVKTSPDGQCSIYSRPDGCVNAWLVGVEADNLVDSGCLGFDDQVAWAEQSE